METKGIAGYAGQSRLIMEDMWEEVEYDMNHSFEMAFNLLDWFQAENVHRFRPGTPIKQEKYLLKYLKRQAQNFIQKIESYEEAYQARTIFRPLPPLSLDRTPEDLFPEIMSYLSPIVRLENLRKKYTNKYLMTWLNKKTVSQLQYIYEHFEMTFYNTFIAVTYNFDMYGWEGIRDSYIDIGEYLEQHPDKPNRVAAIVQLYIIIEDQLMNTLIKPNVYDKQCDLVIKMLHLLVIVCQNLRKVSQRKRRCHDARIMTKVPV